MRPQRYLSYANVTATLALFVALGGTSYALSRVGTNDIVDNSLRSRDVRNDSLRSKDLRNQTIRGRDVRQNALGEREIREQSLAQVPLAGNAERLAGFSSEDFRLRCPPETRAIAGVCIEIAARSALGFLSASAECDAAGRTLPTMPQLDLFVRPGGILSPEGEWTSSVYLEASGASTAERLEALIMRGASVDHARVNAPNSFPFRCVALPSN